MLRVALGVVLLSDVSFRPTYRSVHQVPVLQAGLSPMNTSFAKTQWFHDIGTDYFWFYFPSLLSDGKISHSVAPVSCSGPSCEAFFIPGPTSIIRFDPTSPNITDSLFPDASAFIQYDAPGYQIDFYPIDEMSDPTMTLNDCHVYGLDGLAVQLCLKQSNSSLLAGTSIPEICF
jgi:hypothetical protein